jgi:hypothetical protein
MKTITLHFGVLLAVVFGSGCATIKSSSLLPSEEQETSRGFSSYEDAYSAFSMISVGTTRRTELPSIGFDPKSPNVTVLRYTDVVSIFLSNPSLTKDDIPEGVADCLKAQGGCVAYLFKIGRKDKKRYGSFFADMMNFRKKVQTTGWEFEALIVAIDDIVVYSLHSGQPNIDTKEIERNPLGPLQGIGGSDLKDLLL